jgi:hypothetical protein
MQEMLSQMHFPENMSFPFSMRQLRFLSSLGLLLSVLVIGILVLLSPPLHAGSFRARGTAVGLAGFPAARIRSMPTCSPFASCDTGPSIPAASVCYPVEAGSLRSGIRSPHG